MFNKSLSLLILFIVFIILIYLVINRTENLTICTNEKFTTNTNDNFQTNLFWQYPVITEKTFYLQNKNNKSYLGVPWATILDKNMDFNIIDYKILKDKSLPAANIYILEE